MGRICRVLIRCRHKSREKGTRSISIYHWSTLFHYFMVRHGQANGSLLWSGSPSCMLNFRVYLQAGFSSIWAGSPLPHKWSLPYPESIDKGSICMLRRLDRIGTVAGQCPDRLPKWRCFSSKVAPPLHTWEAVSQSLKYKRAGTGRTSVKG